MGNQVDQIFATDDCPVHSNNKITKICLCEDCLEPLCPLCLPAHYRIHDQLGYPSKIETYSKIHKEYNKKTKQKQQKTEEDFINDTTPLSLLLKEMTAKYFKQRENTESYKVNKILSNLELWKELNNDPYAQKNIKRFLTQHLKANKAVVGEYSHLYNQI